MADYKAPESLNGECLTLETCEFVHVLEDVSVDMTACVAPATPCPNNVMP